MKRDSTGKFLGLNHKTWKEKYPTGRKHCTGHCGRWRHVHDFSVKKWASYRRQIPLALQSRCRTCETLRARLKRGQKPKNWYPCGDPRSATYQARRTEQKRRRYHELKQDPEWLERRREYARFRNNAVNGTDSTRFNTNLGVDRRLPKAPFLEIVQNSGYDPHKLSDMTGVDYHVFTREGPFVSVSTADKTFTALGKPELMALLYG